MQHKYRLGAVAGALAIGLMAASAEAAPPSTLGNDVGAAAGNLSGVQTVHWDRPYYRYYYPRRHYRYDYGYRTHPYYYGYGPGYGFSYGPRYYRRGWW